MKFALKFVAATVIAASATGAFAQKGETVKIAWLDPLSGLMASVGTNQLKTFQFLAEEFNKKNAAGVKFEIIGIDNKLSPQETTSALRSAQDQGARYIAQGNGSGPALAIIDAVEKNNARNPGKELLYLNYAAVDPDLTNSKCSYWQFRFDADTSMKMEALTTYMKDQPEIKKVYILGQNYSHGQQVSKFAKQNLKDKRPDIQIVGDDLHPLAQVRDFSPYIAKIKASGADSVITGNWGSDLALLIKAANDSGLNVKFYTYYAVTTGTPTAMGAASDGKVYQVGYAHYNMGGEIGRLSDDFKKKFNDDLYTSDIYTVFTALVEGFVRAKSTDPVKVAAAMEGMKFKSFNGDVELRKADHQLQQGLYITKWEKASAKYPYNPENTGYTLAPVKFYDAYVASTPTSCQMKRP
ncbi:MAG: branched-chain amino acid ABC transporter substrate-binding protein [Variovorax sp.]|nr:MAG: branched-chain amino acid ABC transporter substrate-binding protein [Variovorax sp.]